MSVSSHKEGAVAKPKRKAISPQRLFRRSKHKYRLVSKDGVTIHVGVMLQAFQPGHLAAFMIAKDSRDNNRS